MNSTDVRQQRKRAVTAHEADLGQRWTEAYDCWVDAPGTTCLLYTRPQTCQQDKGTNEWPMDVRQLTFPIFGIAASNPLGKEWPDERNREANRRLEQDLLQLEQQQSYCWWHSYGFGDIWREDGFDVSCQRYQILELARKYKQGTVCELSLQTSTNHG